MKQQVLEFTQHSCDEWRMCLAVLKNEIGYICEDVTIIEV